jgi:hypothetical protein
MCQARLMNRSNISTIGSHPALADGADGIPDAALADAGEQIPRRTLILLAMPSFVGQNWLAMTWLARHNQLVVSGLRLLVYD